MAIFAGFIRKTGEIRLRGRWQGGDAERARVTLEDGNSGEAVGVTGGRIPFGREAAVHSSKIKVFYER
jgi:hypothetical protein